MSETLDRVERTLEEITQIHLELALAQKETEKAMAKLAEVVAGSIMVTNGLYDKVVGND